ncbi:solute carrier family 22 member 7-like isoform X1 [Haliotis rufescens]|uniref:solute carrier family 22 member 7-like isoform X1 n=1 Tax=Haliotis rufescens TaxID=6454 RepID=UPI00201F2F2F|nr:solute carrier family 22 member 7-like isoform X1 [Haliotis rufescens]
MHSDVRVEDVLRALGTSKRYHICQYVWLFLSMLTVTYGILGYVFVGKSVTSQCATLSTQSTDGILASINVPAIDVVGIDSIYNECTVDVTVNTATTSQTVVVGCLDGQDFGSLRFTSVVSEFGLVCDRKIQSRLPQFLVLAGEAFGAITIPLLADRLGRKPMIITAHAATLLLTVAMAFSRSIVELTILKAFSGIFIEGVLLVLVTMALELTLTKERKILAFFLLFSWSIAGLTLSAIGFSLRLMSWRTIQYALAAGSLVVFAQILILNESIRWLFAVGRYKSAQRLVEFAAEVNGVDVDEKLIYGVGHKDEEDVITTTTPAPTTNSNPANGTTPASEDTPTETSVPDVTPTETSVSGDTPTGTSITEDTTTETSVPEVTPTGTSIPEDKPAGTSIREDTLTETSGPEDTPTRTHVPEGAPIRTSVPEDASQPATSVGTAATTSTAIAPILVAGTASEISTRPRVVTTHTGFKEDIDSPNCCAFARNKHLLINLIIFVYIWFVIGFSYYTLYLTESSLADDLYLNFTINVLSELPAAIILLFAVDSIGRKKTIFLFLGTAVGFLTLSTIVRLFAGPGVTSVALPLFGFLGKLGVAGTYYTLFLYVEETLPTTYRLIGFGTAGMSGKLGALGAPFMVFVAEDMPWFPTALISALLFIAIFVAIPLPETKGKDLPQTVDDIEELYRD